MAKEILSIPEENLRDVIGVIRSGLKHFFFDYPGETLSTKTIENLWKWCIDEEEYLNRSETYDEKD